MCIIHIAAIKYQNVILDTGLWTEIDNTTSTTSLHETHVSLAACAQKSVINLKVGEQSQPIHERRNLVCFEYHAERERLKTTEYKTHELAERASS